MSRHRTSNLMSFGAAAAMVFAACAVAKVAQAQTKYASDTFTIISRGDGRRVDMHVEGRGDHCWATTSDDYGIGIAMGDNKCELWDEGVDDEASLYAKVAPDKITFRISGKSYTIGDSATVKRARGLFDPLVSIEEQQSALGARQRGLGAKQRELGRQQREVKVKVPDMSADIQKVEAEAKRLNTQGGTQSELGDLQSELGELQSRVGDLQSQAGEQQSKVGDQQSELGDQQSALGDQQSELGDKAEQMANGLADELREMLMLAIKDGTAKSE